MATASERMLFTQRIRVRGLVQGVGFRPTVWRLANEHSLRGEVFNDGDGVLITAHASTEQFDAFIQALRNNCPPLARIDHIEQVIHDGKAGRDGFHIAKSDPTTVHTGVVPDAATCPDCLRELKDRGDRRYRYPFTNCTHCGPRLSIVRRLPYDRANTSMAGFTLCESCRAEYEDPSDRRFHAQPTACPDCGPEVWLSDGGGNSLPSEEPIHTAAARLAVGDIVAIKGIGGFHLACDASNATAVTELRRRKHRPHKPLAMMAKDLDQIRAFCNVSTLEAETLSSPAAPIVILDAIQSDRLPEAIAPGQRQWGFMLPYSPLHHLLMQTLDGPLVLTSGNRSDDPQCIDNADALHRLGEIADLFLLHERPIEHRIDDSVVRKMGNQMQLLRRARGYAPGHIPLPNGFDGHPELLALGGELKNSFCLLKDGQAILSQHLGDLEHARTYADYRRAIALYRSLYDHRPEVLVLDAHPEYLSSKLGQAWAAEEDLAVIEVQHHHAHIAACMTDNGIGLDQGPVLGITLDGLGLGDDGSLWGGEFLLADYLGYQRLAHLKPVAMPGGAMAIREPWRNSCAQLLAAGENISQLAWLQDKPVAAIEQMIAKGVNAPLSSSAGRLFDAVAAAVGCTPERISFEGQAAMALEAELERDALDALSAYPFAIRHGSNALILDPTPCWQALLADLQHGETAGGIAARFHRGLAEVLIETAITLGREHSIGRIALSGGVFQNRSLFEWVSKGLGENGFQVLVHQQVPTNDGGLALGQAVIAAARLIKQRL